MAVVHILMPLNTKAKTWIYNHVDPKLMHYGDGIVILDTKYLETIALAMETLGFKRGSRKDIGTKNQKKFDFITNTIGEK